MTPRWLVLGVAISVAGGTSYGGSVAATGVEGTRRSGLALGAAVGPSFFVGFGLGDTTATGAGLSLRIGTTAGEKWLWIAQIDVNGFLFEDMTGEIGANQFAMSTIGAQVYLSRAFWLKGSVGLATYRREVQNGVALQSPELLRGAGLGLSAGIDVFRRGKFALGLEVLTSAALVRGGGGVQSWLALGAHLY